MSEIPADITTVAEFDSDDLTPTDRPVPYKQVPQRGVRKRLLDGGGDYCIYVVTEGEHGLPHGALVPVDGVPRFESPKRAKTWLRSESGDLLTNRQVIIFRAIELINVTVKRVTKVVLMEKAKTVVSGKTPEELEKLDRETD